MWSGKTSCLVMIVGLIIFIISLVIGRPWWQALLFGIAFVLLAAFISGMKLRLLERRILSNKPPEPINKTDVFEKMDLMLADLSAQPGVKTEDVQWMTEYTRIMKGMGELIYDVHNSVLSRNEAEELRALKKAVKQLSYLINEFKNLPEPTTPKRQKAMRYQTEGMDLYLLACSNFIQAFETNDDKLGSIAAKQIKEASDLMDKSSAMFEWK